MSRPKKKPADERRVIAERYRAYQRNHPERICREHGIARHTLAAYAREFGVAVGRPSRSVGR